MLTTAGIMIFGVAFDVGVWYYSKDLVIFNPEQQRRRRQSAAMQINGLDEVDGVDEEDGVQNVDSGQLLKAGECFVSNVSLANKDGMFTHS